MNVNEAVKWYRKAAEQGNLTLKFTIKIGFCLLSF